MKIQFCNNLWLVADNFRRFNNCEMIYLKLNNETNYVWIKKISGLNFIWQLINQVSSSEINNQQ